jgi:hypothetical protein
MLAFLNFHSIRTSEAASRPARFGRLRRRIFRTRSYTSFDFVAILKYLIVHCWLNHLAMIAAYRLHEA